MRYVLLILLMLAPVSSAAESIRLSEKTFALIIKTAEQGEGETQLRAASLLGATRSNDKRALAVLVKLSKHDKPVYRQTAAQSLGLLDNPSAAKAVSALLSDSDADVRAEVCVAFARLKAKKYANKLPLDDESKLVRLAAIRACAVIGKSRSADLSKLFRGESSDVLRAEIVRSLSELGDEGALKVATRALSDKSPLVQEAGCAAIANFATDKSGNRVSLKGSWKTDAIRSITSKSGRAKRGEVDSNHLKSPYPNIRREAISAYYALSPARAEPMVVDALSDKDFKVRARAAMLLGKRKRANNVAHLVKLFEDPAREVRRSASTAIIAINPKANAEAEDKVLSAEEVALAAIKSGKVLSQIEGLWMLGTLKSSSASSVLSLAKDKADPRLNRMVMWLVAELNITDGGNLAKKYYKSSKDVITRVHAANALSVVKPAGASSLLASTILDYNVLMKVKSWVIGGRLRDASFAALATFNDDRANSTMVEILTTVEPTDSMKTYLLLAKTLASNKYTSATSALKKALASNNQKTKLTGTQREVVEVLIKALQSGGSFKAPASLNSHDDSTLFMYRK